jgi:N-acetylglucosaminylphosphatidylinositol deacetylase
VRLCLLTLTIALHNRSYIQHHHSNSISAYTLTTTSLPRKYASLFDLPLTLLIQVWRRTFGAITSNTGPPALEVNSLAMWWHGVQAFQQHETQNSWDRKLYAVVSRYMWFNDLKEVEWRGGLEDD